MATDEEIYKIIMKTEGEDKARSLAAAVEKEEANLRKLIATLGTHDAATRASASALGDMQQQLKEVSGQTGIASHKLMQLGQTLDDLQYVPEQGLRPIINNVMQLSPALGMAMIAVQLLYTNFDTLAGLFGKGHTKSESEEMEALAKATKRTADEEERYQKLKERSKHVEAQGKEPEAVSARKDAIDKAIAEGPKEAIEKDVDRIFGAQIRTMAEIDPRYAAAAQFKRDFGSAGDAPQFDDKGRKVISDRDAARNKANQKKADDDLNAIYGEARQRFMADLGKDDQKGNLKRLTEGATDPADRDRLRRAARSPEQVKADEKDEKQFEAQKKANEERNARLYQEARQKEADDKAFTEKERADEKQAMAESIAEEARQAKAQADEKKRLADIKAKDDEVNAIVDQQSADAFAQDFNDQKKARELARTVRDEDRTMAEAMKGPDRRNSSVIGAADMARSIQSAVGGPDKQLEQQKKITQVLEQIRDRRDDREFEANFGRNGNLGMR